LYVQNGVNTVLQLTAEHITVQANSLSA